VAEESFKMAKSLLTDLNPNALFASGTNAYFAEINRHRLPDSSTSLPCFSINPQVHAHDNWSMVESLAAQPQTIETTRQFAARSVVISPITLQPRFNPNVTDKNSSMASSDTFQEADGRQMSLFGAGWTLGSLGKLAATGHLHSLTYFETTGNHGIMKSEPRGDEPSPFSHLQECVYPIYHVFADLAGYDRVCPTYSSHPLQTEGLTLLNSKNERRIIVANLVAESQEIKIKTGTCQARIRYLDETNVHAAMHEPETFREAEGTICESRSSKIALQLKHYALARVDVVG
jgi:hypothetical protein